MILSGLLQTMIKTTVYTTKMATIVQIFTYQQKATFHIAAETPMLLNSIASALESYSESAPHVEFFLSSGQINHLLDKLINERIDILLLADDSTEPLGKQYASVRIPYEKTKMLVTTLGLTVENPDEEKWIRVVWKKSLKSKNRDRVITALEMEHCRLKCGYADYLD